MIRENNSWAYHPSVNHAATGTFVDLVAEYLIRARTRDWSQEPVEAADESHA
jgi:hypothetical protein